MKFYLACLGPHHIERDSDGGVLWPVVSLTDSGKAFANDIGTHFLSEGEIRLVAHSHFEAARKAAEIVSDINQGNTLPEKDLALDDEGWQTLIDESDETRSHSDDAVFAIATTIAPFAATEEEKIMGTARRLAEKNDSLLIILDYLSAGIILGKPLRGSKALLEHGGLFEIECDEDKITEIRLITLD